MLDAAEGVGVVARKGAWYSYGDTRLGQGREKTLVMLEDDTGLSECASARHHAMHEYPAQRIYIQWLECSQHLHIVVGSLACTEVANSLHGDVKLSAYQRSKTAAQYLEGLSVLTDNPAAIAC